MKYALVSDIHANQQAWNAVLLDIRSIGVDKIICLGDIVGYGPSPAEVLESVYANVDYFVLGNHDAVICEKMDASLFNDCAQEIILWTREQLGKNAVKFLTTLPLSLKDSFFRCTHGAFADPASFNYILEPAEAKASWDAVKEPLLFVGHTHKPAIWILGQSGTPHLVEAQDFMLEEGKRFLVNVGSVGQPRDGQARACYCILDADQRSVVWRRVPFDLDGYRQALEKTGVSAEPSYFLRHDPREAVPPIRELLSFSPARNKAEAVRDVVEVAELKTLERRVARWKIISVAVAVAALVGGAAVGAWLWKPADRAQVIAGPMKPLVAAVAMPEANILSLPAGPLSAGKPIPGWTIRLGDKGRQQVAVDSEGRFVMTSGTLQDEMRVESALIAVEPGMSLCLEGLFLKEKDFTGTIAAVVSLFEKAGSNGTPPMTDQFLVKEPTQARAGGWLSAKKTFTVPANAEFLRLSLRGRFRGQVTLRDLHLERRK